MAVQVAGEQYETITGQLFEIGRQLRQPSGYPFDPEQLKVALQNAIEGKFGPEKPVRKPKAPKQPSLLTVVAVTETTTGPVYTLAPTQNARFVAWAAAAIGMPSDTHIDVLSKRLIDGGHTLTDEEALDLARHTDKGDPTGMRIDGYANFYFKVNARGGVSVGHFYRGARWHSGEYSLGDAYVWNAGYRLLVRNVDPGLL